MSTLTPATLGLEESSPADTYLDDAERVWIGTRWDICERHGQFHLYRKGNWAIAVNSFALALAIIADQSGNQ